MFKRAGVILGLGLLMLVFAGQAFAANGTFDRTWGKGVSPGGGTGFEICIAPTVCDSLPVGGTLAGELTDPGYTAVDESGNVYVTEGGDTGNHRVSKYTADGDFLLTWGKDVTVGGGTGPEVCVPAQGHVCKAGVAGTEAGALKAPTGIAVLPGGFFDTIVVAERGNSRIQKFFTTGETSSVWGKDVIDGGGTGYEVCNPSIDTCKEGELGQLAGEMYSPQGMGVAEGDVFMVDAVNTTVTRYEANGDPNRVFGKNAIAGGPDVFEVCIAGDDTCDGAAVAGALRGEMHDPRGLTADDNGIYVADMGNHRIQKFQASGAFIRAWGHDVIVGGSTGSEVCTITDTCKAGDASATFAAGFHFPTGITTDPSGDVYVSDSNTETVRKFSQVGTWKQSWGGNVVLSGPGETASDGAEVCNVSLDVCQVGELGFTGGEFATPLGMAANAAGDIYVADRDNNRIQKFDDIPNPAGGGGGGGNAIPQQSGATGQQAAATKKCKKKKPKKKKKKCLKKAKKLPI